MTIFKHCSRMFVCKIISHNFENGLPEQIIIDEYTVENLNNIDIDEIL